MNLDFAVERLYQVGWTPAADEELVRFPDGRHVPSVSCVKREFGRAGLQLSVQRAPRFQCYRASWRLRKNRPKIFSLIRPLMKAPLSALASRKLSSMRWRSC